MKFPNGKKFLIISILALYLLGGCGSNQVRHFRVIAGDENWQLFIDYTFSETGTSHHEVLSYQGEGDPRNIELHATNPWIGEFSERLSNIDYDPILNTRTLDLGGGSSNRIIGYSNEELRSLFKAKTLVEIKWEDYAGKHHSILPVLKVK